MQSEPFFYILPCMNPIEIVESDKNCVSEMSLGFQVTVGKQLRGGHNLTPLVGIGLKETLNHGWAKTHPANPLTTSMHLKS